MRGESEGKMKRAAMMRGEKRWVRKERRNEGR